MAPPIRAALRGPPLGTPIPKTQIGHKTQGPIKPHAHRPPFRGRLWPITWAPASFNRDRPVIHARSRAFPMHFPCLSRERTDQPRRVLPLIYTKIPKAAALVLVLKKMFFDHGNRYFYSQNCVFFTVRPVKSSGRKIVLGLFLR